MHSFLHRYIFEMNRPISKSTERDTNLSSVLLPDVLHRPRAVVLYQFAVSAIPSASTATVQKKYTRVTKINPQQKEQACLVRGAGCLESNLRGSHHALRGRFCQFFID